MLLCYLPRLKEILEITKIHSVNYLFYTAELEEIIILSRNEHTIEYTNRNLINNNNKIIISYNKNYLTKNIPNNFIKDKLIRSMHSEYIFLTCHYSAEINENQLNNLNKKLLRIIFKKITDIFITNNCLNSNRSDYLDQYDLKRFTSYGGEVSYIISFYNKKYNLYFKVEDEKNPNYKYLGLSQLLIRKESVLTHFLKVYLCKIL